MTNCIFYRKGRKGFSQRTQGVSGGVWKMRFLASLEMTDGRNEREGGAEAAATPPPLLPPFISHEVSFRMKRSEMRNLMHYAKLYPLFLALLLLCGVACTNPPASQQQAVDVSIPEEEPPQVIEIEEKSPLVLLFDSLGLVDIQTLEPSILVDLKYATADNFTGEVIYPDLRQAYFHPIAAAKLAKAQQILQEQHPGFSLLVYDAARPLHIQQLLWESVKETPLSRYVAHPEKTGLHNYGMAVDVTIADSLHIPLDMGTPFDYFGAKAGINHEDSLLRMGLLTREQINNRHILRSAMRQAGFYPIEGEWWHFNACSLGEAKERYLLIL